MIPAERLFTIVSQSHLQYPDVTGQLSSRPMACIVKQPVQHEEAIYADVIVMGKHGRTGFEHALGRVAEEVARTAPCSVLTVRPEAFAFRLP